MPIQPSLIATSFNHITEGIIIIDGDGQVEACNTAVEKLFGYPEAELAQKPIYQLILPSRYHATCQKWIAHRLARLTENQQSPTFHLAAIRSNQQQFPAVFTVASLHLEGVNRFIVTIKDVSEQQLLEKNQEELENRLRRDSLMRHLAEVINESLDWHEILNTTVKEVGHFFEAERVLIYRFVFHPDTQLFENIVATQYCANPQVAPITDEEFKEEAENITALMSGLSRRDLGTYNQKNLMKKVTNMTLEERFQLVDAPFDEFRDETANIDRSKIENLQADRPPISDEWLKAWEKQKDFGERLVEKYKLHVTLEAAIMYKGLFYGKITLWDSNPERHWTEDEHVLVQFVANQLGGALAQSELYAREQKARAEAEVANRKKSEFLGMMSHELRTPLNAIIGFSDMTLNGMSGPLNAKQTTYVSNVLSSGKHLLDIVNDLLDVSQVEIGQLAIQLSRFELKPLLESIRMMMQESASKRHIQLFFEIAPELTMLDADPARFKQILINLLSNAIKFNREQGRVIFRLYPSLDQHWLVGEVEDTGMGIPQEKQANLFAKFYQVDSRMARVHEGTGLGLALTKELLDRHGGEIQVSSVEGQGSTFTFKLPLQAGPVRTSTPDVDSRMPAG